MNASKFLAILILTACGRPCLGDVVVLANRTGREIEVRVVDGLVLGRPIKIPPLDVVPIETRGPCEVEVASARSPRRYSLSANAAYYFGSLPNGQVELQQIGLGSDAETERGRRLPGAGREIATISVKIFVDEEEREVDGRWQERLRRRVEAASDVLQRYCRLRLEVVAFGTWNSDNATDDFSDAMAEFEREANPGLARLAIGFSSQYGVRGGQSHVGGTRGPLHSHILHREWPQHVDERLRLEALVHELGHYLGAAHSPEATSIMRPVLGNRKGRPAGGGIQFDPVNTLVMYLVAEELRHRDTLRFAELTPETKQRLRQIYAELSRANPKDDSAKRFLQLVRHVDAPSPLEEATRTVLETIVAVGAQRRGAVEGDARAGDRLVENYVQHAAAAAARFEHQTGPPAFLRALGIAVDHEQTLRAYPATSEFAKAVETEEAVRHRLASMGSPTLRGRADLAQHFFISAYLTAAIGPQAAATTGETKELLDAAGKSGFSFADMASNRAGIALARKVLDGSVSLRDLARGFATLDFMPEVEGLEEGLSLADFRAKYGGKNDPRYQAQLQEIDRRIEMLPAYRRAE